MHIMHFTLEMWQMSPKMNSLYKSEDEPTFQKTVRTAMEDKMVRLLTSYQLRGQETGSSGGYRLLCAFCFLNFQWK